MLINEIINKEKKYNHLAKEVTNQRSQIHNVLKYDSF